VRWNILDTGKRIDGRDVKSPCARSSPRSGPAARPRLGAVHPRRDPGLVVATLGTGEDEQFIDALEGTYKEAFLLHYNFPPFSVGETGRMGAPGPARDRPRQARLAGDPSDAAAAKDEFPYTIRVVSEITESNGSSSMASVCGASLALMDAGVPLKKPDRGIAMGLILERTRFAVLSDILGDEDHLGDMDFKVAGTADGITSLQMDIKIAGITEEIMKVALARPRTAAAHPRRDGKAIDGAPARSSANTRRKIETITIPPTRSAK
jgi:polyribonucleotide nucleotidyltransferase